MKRDPIGRVALAFMVGASSSVLTACWGDGSATAAFERSCAALASTAITNGRITTANFVEATANPSDPSASLPRHCLAQGVMNERTGTDGNAYGIHFEVRLPLEWNKRFYYQGGSGVDGTLPTAKGVYPGGGNTRNALLDGYAVVTTDSGHTSVYDGSTNAAFLFAADPQAREEYGDKQLPLVAGSANALMKALYGQAPTKSYFVGCSNGGRQAMVAAQRHPELFDGIIAAAPGFRLTTASLEGSIFRAQLAATVAPVGTDGLPDISNPLTTAEKAIVKARILAACDALDGVSDGMVSNVSACRPDPTEWVCSDTQTSNCLSASKASYVKKFFEGAKLVDGTQVYASWPYDPGMVEFMGSPRSFAYWIFAGEASHVYTTLPTITTDLFAYARNADLETEYRKLSLTSGIYTRSGRDYTDAESADLDTFRSRGGKILMYNGTADWAFSFHDLAAYYEKLRSRYGDTSAAAFARAYAVPGMDHCSGGADGTDQFDAFGALVNWVEKGVAPDAIVSTARAAAGVSWPGRTRPMCSYPKQAIYNGSGDIESASSFHCE